MVSGHAWYILVLTLKVSVLILNTVPSHLSISSEVLG